MVFQQRQRSLRQVFVTLHIIKLMSWHQEMTFFAANQLSFTRTQYVPRVAQQKAEVDERKVFLPFKEMHPWNVFIFTGLVLFGLPVTDTSEMRPNQLKLKRILSLPLLLSTSHFCAG